MNTEKNILIAEYIGMQKTNIGWYDNEEILNGIEQDNTFDLLLFDKSWNWLLAVVGKISSEFTRENLNYDVLAYTIADATIENNINKAFDGLVLFLSK